MNEQQRTSYAHAAAGYDPEFEQILADAITETIAKASLVTDANVMAIRTGETAAALVFVLEMVMGLSPAMDTPSELRKFAEHTAKRLRKNISRLRADPEFGAEIFGARRGGSA
jgi:hypothetical protein